MAATNVVLARARLAGGIELTREAPTDLQVRPGDEILLKLPYRFDEVSADREDYELHLAIALDDEPEETVSIQAADRPGLSDDKRGFLVQERAILASGDHEIRFRATVRLETSGWGNDRAQVQERTVEGALRVHVR